MKLLIAPTVLAGLVMSFTGAQTAIAQTAPADSMQSDVPQRAQISRSSDIEQPAISRARAGELYETVFDCTGVIMHQSYRGEVETKLSFWFGVDGDDLPHGCELKLNSRTFLGTGQRAQEMEADQLAKRVVVLAVELLAGRVGEAPFVDAILNVAEFRRDHQHRLVELVDRGGEVPHCLFPAHFLIGAEHCVGAEHRSPRIRRNDSDFDQIRGRG